ncbi:hypothetical protein AB1Y20_012852 [Prymnesium parvum]|uniref:Uncharacterized protein n=1 Tax=Prymnesium parvum TaxID=97485 RepID=A0AB34IK07_PRYPA
MGSGGVPFRADIPMVVHSFVTSACTCKLKKVMSYKEKLAREGLDLNVRGERGRTALQMAAWYGRADVLCWLLEEGATFDTWDDDIWSPLHYAAEWDKQETVKILLAHGDDMHKKDNNGVSPLEAARRMNCRVALVFKEAESPAGLAQLKQDVLELELEYKTKRAEIEAAVDTASGAPATEASA